MLGAPLAIDALSAGTTGASFLVRTATGRFVAKAFLPGSSVLLGPAEQFALLEDLAEAGLAPRPAGFDLRTRLLVTEYVEDASAVSPEVLRRPERAFEVAALLRRLHAVRADVPAFAPERYAADYLARVGGRERLAPADRGRLDELLALAAAALPGEPCLCHNDLAADNLLLGRAPKLIDFDYAVTAPPIVDLASIVVMNDFPDAAASALRDAYYSGKVPFSPAEFGGVERLVRLLAHFWALASPDAGAAIVAQYRIGHD